MKKSPSEAEERARLDAVAKAAAKAVRLNARIKFLQDQLEPLKTFLSEQTPGKYFYAEGRSITITTPSTAIKPGASQVAAARALAKDKAHILFEEVLSHKPVKGFREIARAVFTPARAEKIIALCEVPTESQVRL